MARGLIIAVIDDEPSVTKVVQDALRRRGDVVLVAHTIAEVADLVAQHHRTIDCALIDVNLPDGNGVDLARDLQRQHPNIRVLVTTGGKVPENLEFPLLLKPFSFRDLWAAIA